ncbi:hypothetical protein D3C86_1662350 [compost metagenome]
MKALLTFKMTVQSFLFRWRRNDHIRVSCIFSFQPVFEVKTDIGRMSAFAEQDVFFGEISNKKAIFLVNRIVDFPVPESDFSDILGKFSLLKFNNPFEQFFRL